MVMISVAGVTKSRAESWDPFREIWCVLFGGLPPCSGDLLALVNVSDVEQMECRNRCSDWGANIDALVDFSLVIESSLGACCPDKDPFQHDATAGLQGVCVRPYLSNRGSHDAIYCRFFVCAWKDPP